MLLAALEGTNGEVRHALAIRREAIARLRAELALADDDPRLAALAAQRSATWWIAREAKAPGALLAELPSRPAPAATASAASHPRVGLCVVSKDDGALPRAAESILRAHAPPAIEIFRATPGKPRSAEPILADALRERGFALAPEASRPLEDAARAVALVSVGEPPHLSEAFRGKRIHLWSTTPERPATLAEARDVFGQLTHQARCLVAEYRARLHLRA